MEGIKEIYLTEDLNIRYTGRDDHSFIGTSSRRYVITTIYDAVFELRKKLEEKYDRSELMAGGTGLHFPIIKNAIVKTETGEQYKTDLHDVYVILYEQRYEGKRSNTTFGEISGVCFATLRQV